MKKRLAAAALALVLAAGALPAPASAKTVPAGQTVGTVLFYVSNDKGERVLASQIPVSEMEADLKAGKIDDTLHNYSLLDRYVTTVHQEAQGFLVPDFVSYAQGKSTDASVRAQRLRFAGGDKVAFWEIDQTSFDEMDTYSYDELYGVPRYNFPLLYRYWDYKTQDYGDPEGKLTRDEAVDAVFAGGEPAVFTLSVRAFSQRYMLTEGKYGAGDYNVEGYFQSEGLLDNERTMRVMKPMTEAELRDRQSTASDTRYWVSSVLLEMETAPALRSKGAVDAPTATMTEDAGSYYIRFSCATPGASIYYNHNYVSPSYMPTSLYGGGTVKVPKSWFPGGVVTMTAHAVKDGYTDAGVVTLSLKSSGAEAGGSGYADVAENAWYRDAVGYVSEKGLFDPLADGGFGPEQPMTRLMLARALYRLSGSPAVSGKGPFLDTYDPAVVWAQEQGVVNGTSADTFTPDGSLTREQIAAMLWRYAHVKGADTPAAGELSAFPDGGSTSAWAGEAMAWAVGGGLINGTGAGKLDPQGTASRAQVAQILMKFGK